MLFWLKVWGMIDTGGCPLNIMCTHHLCFVSWSCKIEQLVAAARSGPSIVGIGGFVFLVRRFLHLGEVIIYLVKVHLVRSPLIVVGTSCANS